MQALIDFDGWRKWKDFSQARLKEAGNQATSKPNGWKGRKGKARASAAGSTAA